MSRKIKKRFRLAIKQIGFETRYRSQVKTWRGWRGFYYHMDTAEIHWSSDFRLDKVRQMDNIEGYRRVLGLEKEEIIIEEHKIIK